MAPTLEQHKGALKELKRELALRNSVYPQWVAAGRMDAATAATQIERLEYAIQILENAKAALEAEISQKLSLWWVGE